MRSPSGVSSRWTRASYQRNGMPASRGETKGAKALIGFQPFDFEGFLREVGEPATERVLQPRALRSPDMERLLPIAESNGMVILGPPGPPPGH